MVGKTYVYVPKSWEKYLYDIKKLRNPSPCFYEIDMTNRCNLNCAWCTTTAARKKNTKDAPYESLIRLVDDALGKDLGVTFAGGGEPTLHPRFRDVIKHAIPAIGIGLVSNGTLVDEIRFYLETTKDHKNSWVRLSLNDRPINDGLRKLFNDYPNRIGISIIVEHEELSYPAEELAPLAKFIRKTTPHNIVPNGMRPEDCIGRKFHKIFEPDGTVAWCCQARGRGGAPPEFCFDDCRWSKVDIEEAWKGNPWT